MGKRLNNEIFIKKAKEIHGDEYDYSLINYKNNKTKVNIICKKHGVFSQLPINHINGKSGCYNCYNNVKLTNKEFIEKSQLIHGYKYDYSKVIYKNDKTKIEIICKKHGEFVQLPCVHLDGHGCSKCGNKNDLETFIKKSKLIYGDLFDYNLIEYFNMKSPIKIICKIHGEFIVVPSCFLYSKTGCIYCKGDIKILNIKSMVINISMK